MTNTPGIILWITIAILLIIIVCLAITVWTVGSSVSKYVLISLWTLFAFLLVVFIMAIVAASLIPGYAREYADDQLFFTDACSRRRELSDRWMK